MSPDDPAGLGRLAWLCGPLGAALAAGQGALVGDTTCASRQLHTVDPSRPASIRVVATADAGQVFYGRRDRGAVLHLDIFHQIGLVDHRSLAGAVIQGCDDYAAGGQGRGQDRGQGEGAGWVPPGRRLADLFDVQTATGGGRVTGSLGFGQGRALREAHLSHVHLGCLVPDQGLEVIFWVISAVEREIGRQGLEIRRLESLELDQGASGQRLDLTPYRTPSDSLLRGDPSGGGRLGDAAELPDPGIHQLAVELAGEFGTLRDLERSLASVADRSRARDRPGPNLMSLLPDPAATALRRRGLAAGRDGQAYLTPRGWALHQALRLDRRPIEEYWKRLLRRKPAGAPRGGRPSPGQRRAPPQRESRTSKESRPRAAGQRMGSIAVVPTITAAAARQLRAGPARPGPGRWTVTPSDLAEPRLKPAASQDVCILLDGSASMAGRRLRSAKMLAQHLLLSTRDRVAVIVFQEREAKVVVPFTRNFGVAERGLASIEPFGLTPLAHGLAAAVEYAGRTRRHRCLVLLVTDGIPTVARLQGGHPMADACRAAAELGRRRLRLMCLGLEPNRPFLAELSLAARGSLFIVDELDPQALVLAVREPGPG